MKLKSFARKGLLVTGLAFASVAPASAAIDISDVTAAVTEAEGHAVTLGGAGLGLVVIFVGYKLVRKAIAKALG